MGFSEGKSSVILGIISDLSCLCSVSHFQWKGKNRGEQAQRRDSFFDPRILRYQFRAEVRN